MTDFSYSRNVKCPDCGTWSNSAEGWLCDCRESLKEKEEDDGESDMD